MGVTSAGEEIWEDSVGGERGQIRWRDEDSLGLIF
jgi:hypothetical protein